MDMQRIPHQGEIYNHFKDKLYQIVAVATHSETYELMVVYQALYGDFKTYVRPLDMFMSEVDREKYPDVKQKYRFELRRAQNGESSLVDRNIIVKEEVKIAVNEIKQENAKIKDEQSGRQLASAIRSDNNNVSSGETEEAVSSILLKFLDAQSNSKKLEVLTSNIKHMSDRLINDMAVAVDCTIDEGPLDLRIQGLINCLQAMSRFEDRRLR